MDVASKAASAAPWGNLAFAAVVLGVGLLFYSVIRRTAWFDCVLCAMRLPGPGLVPVITNLWRLRKLMAGIEVHYHKENFNAADMPRLMSGNGLPIEWINGFPVIFRIWLSVVPIVIVSHPSSIKAVLGIKGPNAKATQYRNLHRWLGTGLLTSSGPKWKSRRRLITPAFHFQCLKGYFSAFVREADWMRKNLEQVATEGPFHIYPLVTRATLDIIMECAFGQSMHAQRESDLPYVASVFGMLELTFARMLKPWQWSDALYNLMPSGRKTAQHCGVLHAHTESVIEARRHNLPAEPSCFLDMLLMSTDEDGKPLDAEAIREEVDTFMFEGHDTTSAGITWCLYMLGCNPAIQQRAQAEIDEVLHGQPPTPEVLSQLPYLTAVIKETLRIVPPVPFTARHTQEPLDIGGHVIPAGMDIIVAPVVVHHNDAVWASSWEFDPERHLSKRTDDPRSAHADSWAFIPFSAGPRVCIGQQFAMMEMNVVLCSLLQTLTFAVPEHQRIFIDAKLIFRPCGGKLLMTATPRAPATIPV